ncbi:hypothetical protein [Pseudorhodoplanes sp.]|uniref:hypothetical protein n=1 Tax=Pseudorhodoplanes sp. TaxID=1934341 RepID=UPI002C8B8292|nr:hypothetical protein [Pseudorhodoplanes sp.]HWV44105.1 hypothetical protein [Pseudorhodoplanes sp.]
MREGHRTGSAAVRLTDRQFRALLSAKHKGSAALAFHKPMRTLLSLVRVGYIEHQAPWRLTPSGAAAIDRACGVNQPVRLRAFANSKLIH